MTRLRSAAWVLPGALLVLHGLGHGVLPLRGGGSGPYDVANAMLSVFSGIALVGFVAAGCAVIGIRPFRAHAIALTHISALSSLGALSVMGDGTLWPGALFDLLAAASIGFLVRARDAAARRPAQSGSAVSDTQGHRTQRALRAVARGAALAFVGYLATATVLWPWHRTWGVTVSERALDLPGDRSSRLPEFEVTHGVTIDAPPDAVWPWLMQVGQDRGGFYSYDWLERLFLVHIHNVNELRPEWTSRKVGDFVRATQPEYLGGVLGSNLGWYVTEVQPERALVLHYWGAFVLLSDAHDRTRLIVRSTMSDPDIPAWAAAISFTAFELPHFIMERRMLLGIKQRAERSYGAGAGHARAS